MSEEGFLGCCILRARELCSRGLEMYYAWKLSLGRNSALSAGLSILEIFDDSVFVSNIGGNGIGYAFRRALWLW